MNPDDKKVLPVVQPVQTVRRPVAPSVYRSQPQNILAKTKPVVAQVKTAVAVQDVRRPVAPPVYRPQPVPQSVQAKANINGQASPLTAPGVAQLVQVVQFAEKKKKKGPVSSKPKAKSGRGASGGKSGLGYSSVSGAYSQQQIASAMKAAKVKGVKGHRKGDAMSGVSGQTKHETKKVVKALREAKEKEHAKAQKCRQFHKRRNNGQMCIHCGQTVNV